MKWHEWEGGNFVFITREPELMWGIYVIQPLVCFSLCLLSSALWLYSSENLSCNEKLALIWAPAVIILITHSSTGLETPPFQSQNLAIDTPLWHWDLGACGWPTPVIPAWWLAGPKPLISLVIDEGKGWRKGGKTCMRLQKLMGRSWGDGTVALPEDWGSILGTHMREITTISNTNA